MNRVDRLTGIILLLQGGKRTASEIASHFEVSRRTIQRDIQALSEIGIPVVAELGTDGGYSLPPDYSLPPLALTFHEALLMRLALRGLARLAEAPFKAERDSLLAKVETLMPGRYRAEISHAEQTLSLDVPERAYPTPFLEILLESARSQQWLVVSYRSEKHVSEQTILPARVRATDGLWYCDAYSRERQESRVYRVDRFLSARRVDPPPEPVEDSVPNGHPSLPEARIDLTERGVLILEREPNLGYQIERRESGGRLCVRLRPQEYEWLTRIVLGLGLEATVMAPEALRQRVQSEAEAISRRYSER